MFTFLPDFLTDLSSDRPVLHEHISVRNPERIHPAENQGLDVRISRTGSLVVQNPGPFVFYIKLAKLRVEMINLMSVKCIESRCQRHLTKQKIRWG